MRYKLGDFGIFNLVRVLCLVMLISAANVSAQTTDVAKTEPVADAAVQEVEKKTVLQPALSEYKGIKIGMTADEVREKLDKKPEVADKDGFYYVFSDDETAQIMLDADKKVRVIVAMYKSETAPKYADVFGKDVPLSEMPDGRIYNLIRYPEAGYWVAYNRTAGEDPMITVTIQKF